MTHLQSTNANLHSKIDELAERDTQTNLSIAEMTKKIPSFQDIVCYLENDAPARVIASSDHESTDKYGKLKLIR